MAGYAVLNKMSNHTSSGTSSDLSCVSLLHKIDAYPLYVDDFDVINVKASSNEEPVLSNFYPCSIYSDYNDLTFNSVEHAYQFECATFFGDNDICNKILQSRSAYQVKKLSKQLYKYKIGPPMDEWNKFKVPLMRNLLFRKASSCIRFRERLIESYPHRLTHPVNDGFWGATDRFGQDGLDLFAHLLMEIRLSLILRDVLVMIPCEPPATINSDKSFPLLPKQSSPCLPMTSVASITSPNLPISSTSQSSWLLSASSIVSNQHESSSLATELSNETMCSSSTSFSDATSKGSTPLDSSIFSTDSSVIATFLSNVILSPKLSLLQFLQWTSAATLTLQEQAMR